MGYWFIMSLFIILLVLHWQLDKLEINPQSLVLGRGQVVRQRPLKP